MRAARRSCPLPGSASGTHGRVPSSRVGRVLNVAGEAAGLAGKPVVAAALGGAGDPVAEDGHPAGDQVVESLVECLGVVSARQLVGGVGVVGMARRCLRAGGGGRRRVMSAH